MCLHFLNGTLWARFHGLYWYQSFIDRSNIWGVDRTDPWGPEIDQSPLGRSYLVVVPSYDMSGALILLNGLYGWDSMAGIDINPSSMGPIFGVWIGPTLGVPNVPSAIGPRLFSSRLVWYVRCLDSFKWTLWGSFHGWYWYQSFIDGSNIWGVDRTDPWGPQMDHPPLGRIYSQLFGSTAVVWYVRCLDSPNWTLWVRFHGWYWYQSLINGSNIWCVDSTDPWGPEIDHPPLGRNYLVVVPLYDMSGSLFLLTGLDGWDSMAGIDVNPSSMGPIFRVWIGPTLGVPKWTIRYWVAAFSSYLVVVPSYDMSGALIILTGPYGWDSMAGIDINPSSMGPIFEVWIGPTLGIPKLTVRYWAAAIW